MKKIICCLLFFNMALQAQKTQAPKQDSGFESYKNAGFKEKFELNKAFANEVLPVLSAYESVVEDRFAGVKNFGQLVEKTNFTKSQDVAKLTSFNPDYWRATAEMEKGNELIPVTKIYMLVSQGEFDYAYKYIEMAKLFSNPQTYSDIYLKQLGERLDVFNTELNAGIQKGIAEHDKGNFENAIAIYSEILGSYPASAWANFELFYSKFELNNKNGNKELNNFESWEKAKPGVFGHNPLYSVAMSAKNGKENYLLSRRNAVAGLFKNKGQMLEDIYQYADIALDLEVYDFAAQLFWYSASYDKKEDSLFKFLYCLEKLGITGFKENFKGNFDKAFQKIEKEKEKEMKKSEAFKAYNN